VQEAVRLRGRSPRSKLRRQRRRSAVLRQRRRTATAGVARRFLRHVPPAAVTQCL